MPTILLIMRPEDRYVTFGVAEKGRLLVVSHTEEGEAIRIIKRELYEEG
jgi:uncharacterized DUF497 family protein